MGNMSLLKTKKKLFLAILEIVDHFGGFVQRSKIEDLSGQHPNHPQLHVLNGLGTCEKFSYLILANQLFQHIENDIPLEKEIDIIRCYKKPKLICFWFFIKM